MTVQYLPVPSYPRYLAGDDGTIIGPSGRMLAPTPVRGGYLQVLIYPGRGKRVTRRVHSLVCEAFNGRRPSSAHQCAHWDGNPANNTPGNLRWATSAENIADKIRHGRITRTSGEINARAVLNRRQVEDIRERFAAGESQRSLAREYGVKQPTISNIITRKTWFHI